MRVLLTEEYQTRIEQFIVDHLDPEKYTIQDVVELFILYAEFDFRRMTLAQLDFELKYYEVFKNRLKE